MRLIQNLPNLMTLFNLFLGCMGVVYLYNDHMVIMSKQDDMLIDMGLIHLTCYCVMLAGVVDFFDGFVARMLKVQSELGKQLDSL
ncbi:MAG TPA: CDP-alcohol phosphatidyltransferase family protein, partial [Chitinophagales bacterium]|nr:CDP-alcohol phosphatidyltransferase family protein [Chitinophagales bacterium]